VYASRAGVPRKLLLQEYQERTYTNINISKEDHGRMLLCTPMMGIANMVPSIFQALSPLLLEGTNFNFRITHSNKTESKQVKTTTKDSNFFRFFGKTMQDKNKVKQNLKQSKGCVCETSLAEVFFLPGNGARNSLMKPSKLLASWKTPRARCDEYSSKLFPQ
jgi:hypothetical protein